jgi:hypothetical protein
MRAKELVLAFPLPTPDIADKATNSTGQAVMLLLMVVGSAMTLAAALWLFRVFGTPLPLLVVAGSAFSALTEPLCDVAVGIWYYQPGQRSIWSAFGNSFPVWTFFSFIVFYGGIALALWYLVERGASRRDLLRILVPTALAIGIGEVIMTNVAQVYTYYGPKAFPIAGYPAWIPLMVTAVVTLEATALSRVRRGLPGPHQLVPALFLPAAVVCMCLFFIPMTSVLLCHTSTETSASSVYLGAGVSAVSLCVRLM